MLWEEQATPQLTKRQRLRFPRRGRRAGLALPHRGEPGSHAPGLVATCNTRSTCATSHTQRPTAASRIPRGLLSAGSAGSSAPLGACRPVRPRPRLPASGWWQRAQRQLRGPPPAYRGFWAPLRPPAAGQSPASPWPRDPPSWPPCWTTSGSRDAGPWARPPARSSHPTCGCSDSGDLTGGEEAGRVVILHVVAEPGVCIPRPAARRSVVASPPRPSPRRPREPGVQAEGGQRQSARGRTRGVANF